MMKRIMKFRGLAVLFSLAFALMFAGWATAYFSLRGVDNTPLILHFDDIEGITAVGGIGYLMGFGAFGMLAVLLNFGVAMEFAERNRFLAWMMGAATLIFASLLFIGFFAIVNVN